MNNLYTIIGNEKILIEENINKIKEKYINKEIDFINIDLEELSIITLLQELNTIPLLEDYRFIILRNPIFLNENNTKYDKRLIEEFKSFILNPSPTTILITIIDSSYKSQLVDILYDNTNIIKLDDLKNESLEEIVINSFTKDGYNISPIAISELLYRINHDYIRVLLEIEKLKIYKFDTKEITKEDISLLVSKDLEDSVFSIIEAILDNNKGLVMDIYSELILSGVDESIIISNLIRSFNELYQTKELTLNGVKKDEIAKIFNCKPGRVFYLIKSSNKISKSKIKENINYLIDMDYKIKKNQIDKKLALELYLLK